MSEEAVTAAVGEIEIAYETFGEATSPPVLLVMGLGVQMLGWDAELCGMLAARGHYVIRFDNRDVGLSTHLHDAPPPDFRAIFSGDTSSASYRIEDMADDTAGLLDALELPSTHVVGLSMGGMIAQTLAQRHSERVRSLTSIMSTPGPRIGPPTQAALQMLLTPPPTDEEGAVEHVVAAYRVIGSPGFPMDEAALRDRARRSYRRAFDPAGTGRQLAAIHASGDRTSTLADVRVPTRVVHGAEDPLITVAGGHATAAAIPGAEIDVIEGMGHDLPRALWPRFVDSISENVARGETLRAADV
jgi:pimeloyl-ACP methyl ester carboxylesterase